METKLTEWLLKQKLTKLKQKYVEFQKCKGSHSSNLHKSEIQLIEKILENESMYCHVCKNELGKNHIGKNIVIQKRGRTNVTTKWYCVPCSESKNITVGN